MKKLFLFILATLIFLSFTPVSFASISKLNKQHIDPNLMLMISGSSDGLNTMTVKNTEILPAVEIYIRKKIYFYSKGVKKVYAV